MPHQYLSRGTDVEFYSLLGRLYLHTIGPAAPGSSVESVFVLNSKHVGGGGDQAVTHIIREVCLQPTLAVLDSDRKRANAALGDTAKKAIRQLKKCHKDTPVLAELIILSSRMLENLIPRELLLEAKLQNARNNKDFMQALEREKPPHAYGSEALRFLNGKDGLRLADLEEMRCAKPDKNDSTLAFRCELADRLQQELATAQVEPAGGWCSPPNLRCEGKPEQCRCILFYGLGKKIVSELVSALNKRLGEEGPPSPALLKALFGAPSSADPMQKERLFIAERVLAWAVAAKKQRQDLL